MGRACGGRGGGWGSAALGHVACSCRGVPAVPGHRTKYESHESKRKLCNSYDIFLADERVLASLPKLIGAAGWGHWRAWPLAPCQGASGTRKHALLRGVPAP